MQWWETFGVFATQRRKAFTVTVFICLSIYNYSRTHEIWYWQVLRKFVNTVWFWLKTKKKTHTHLTWRPTCVAANIANSTLCRGPEQTIFLFTVPSYPETVPIIHHFPWVWVITCLYPQIDSSSYTLTMKPEYFSQTYMPTYKTRCHNAGGPNLNNLWCENLKTYNSLRVYRNEKYFRSRLLSYR